MIENGKSFYRICSRSNTLTSLTIIWINYEYFTPGVSLASCHLVSEGQVRLFEWLRSRFDGNVMMINDFNVICIH